MHHADSPFPLRLRSMAVGAVLMSAAAAAVAQDLAAPPVVPPGVAAPVEVAAPPAPAPANATAATAAAEGAPRTLRASEQPPGTIPPLSKNEPVVRRTVVEDEGSRIEELNVRGAVRSIRVKPKGPIQAEYEIIPTDASHDPSAGPSSLKGAQGQRVWRVMDF